MNQEEDYNKFQLKLTKNSKIISIPRDFRKYRYRAQSILDVKCGHQEFLDFSGTLTGFVKTKSKRFIRLTFQCFLSQGTFIVKSEPSSSLNVDEIMKAYKGKTLKIRAAKILEVKDKRNEQTIIYKNFDAIRYLNDK